MDQPHINAPRAFGIASELIRLHNPPEIFLVLLFPALSVLFCAQIVVIPGAGHAGQAAQLLDVQQVVRPQQCLSDDPILLSLIHI